jgi:hypothetical protein
MLAPQVQLRDVLKLLGTAELLLFITVLLYH